MEVYKLKARAISGYPIIAPAVYAAATHPGISLHFNIVSKYSKRSVIQNTGDIVK